MNFDDCRQNGERSRAGQTDIVSLTGIRFVLRSDHTPLYIPSTCRCTDYALHAWQLYKRGNVLNETRTALNRMCINGVCAKWTVLTSANISNNNAAHISRL